MRRGNLSRPCTSAQRFRDTEVLTCDSSEGAASPPSVYAALDTGKVTVRFDSFVESVDFVNGSQPLVTLWNGETVKGDLVVGADGIHSVVRKFVTGVDDQPQDTGDAAYR